MEEINWKEICMKILFTVGRSEGTWFEPWDGVSEKIGKIVTEEYEIWEKEKTENWSLKSISLNGDELK